MRHSIFHRQAAGARGSASMRVPFVLARLTGTLAQVLALSLTWSLANAWPSYGEDVDAFCAGYDGSTPYADLGSGVTGCVLCHRDNSGNGAQPGTWDWWRNGNLELFCTGTPPNRAPDGRITAPATNQRIDIGSTLRFEGTASDPDGDALNFSWDFGVGNATGPGPHVIAYPNAGSFTVRLTVSDGNLADPSPATRRIDVTDTSGCTDADGDGWLTGDASCAPIDCDDADPAVSPGAVEDCTDGRDNDCNGLIDDADPDAIGCLGCLDGDNDGFSPEGGLCGPIDCDDTNPAVSPGAVEDCTDGRDNDCDFYLDDTDPDCNGGDCRSRLLRDPGLGILTAPDGGYGAAEPLDGLVVSGAIHVFIAEQDGIELVQWLVDGQLVNTDAEAPWTLGDDGDDHDGDDHDGDNHDGDNHDGDDHDGDDHDEDDHDEDDHDEDDHDEDDHDEDDHDRNDHDRNDHDGGALGTMPLYDTRGLANGWHRIAAQIAFQDGSRQHFTAAVLIDPDDENGQYMDAIQEAYVTYYGRPADPPGLGYWAGRLRESGGNLDALIAVYGTSPEFTERFGELDDTALIDNLYWNLFSRSPDAAGRAWYLQRLEELRARHDGTEGGATEYALSHIALDILNGAQNLDRIAIENRVEVAHYFTARVAATGWDYSVDQITPAADLLRTVTATVSTVADGKAAVDQLVQ